ncbi:S41 family peptidase, partial [Candidatus Peregrinibacteria bacterium]|nr:S41 family peptidase [Candidatus Peregrinibacteria bacterium]
VEVEIPENNYTNPNSQYDKTEQELLENANFAILLDVWSAIKKDYFYQDEVDEEKLILGAIEGMANELNDVYTNFNKPEDAELLLNQLSGTFQGVGMIIEAIEDTVTVIAPLKNSPAEAAGIKAKDIIIEVDNESVIGQSVNEVANKIKGPAGTKVKVKVLRDKKEVTLDLTRSFVLKTSVFEEVLTSGTKKIGYLSLINFGNDTYNEMLEAADSLLAQNVDGLIIDLRNNPGGYLEIAVSILGLFTDTSKTAVKLVDPKGNINEMKTLADGKLANIKTVILINEGSASASEILAGALKDYGLATLIGTKSFGKGSVQELKYYPNSSLFKFTSAKWLTPKDHEIDKIGITPDKVIENLEAGEDLQLKAALAEF